LMNNVPHALIGKVAKTSGFCVYGLNSEIVVETRIDELLEHWKSFLVV